MNTSITVNGRVQENIVPRLRGVQRMAGQAGNIHRVRSRPEAGIGVGAEYRPEVHERAIRAIPERDAPPAEVSVVRAGQILGSEGPSSIERATDQLRERLDAGVSPRSDRHTLVGWDQIHSGRQNAEVGRGAETVSKATARNDGCAIRVVRVAQEGATTALPVQDSGLAVGANDREDEIAHVGMLHIQADLTEL